MTESEIKAAIENGTKEFVSASKQAKYTIRELFITTWWRADITNVHSGDYKGTCTRSTLENFCETLSKIKDLEPFMESDLVTPAKSNKDLAEVEYSITPSEMCEIIRLSHKGYLAKICHADTLTIRFSKGNETKTFEFPHC